MRNTAFVLLIGMVFTLPSYSQPFYKSYNSPEFKTLALKGITYVRVEDEARNKVVEEALNKYWTSTPFKVVDPKDESLTDKTILLTEMTLTRTQEYGMQTTITTEKIIALIKLGDLLKKEVDKYSAIGYICIDGFNQKEDYKDNNHFMGLTISALHKCVEKIKRKKITGGGMAFYKKLGASINTRVSMLKRKTLLVVGDTYDFVETKALDKAGIKYKQITEEYLADMSQEQRDKSCLLYFGYNSYTDVIIIDLKDNSLIYTYHYVGAHPAFDKKDVKKIVSYFQ